MLKQLTGRKLQIATGEAGLSEHKRDAYRERFAGCGFELPDIVAGERVKRRRVSTLGTRLRSAIEATGHYTPLSGNARRYLKTLDRPGRYYSDDIADRLVSEMRVSDGVRDAIKAIVEVAMIAEAEANPIAAKPEKDPDVSDVGNRLREAIEAAGKYTMTCGTCIAFLQSLNRKTEHDADAIVQRLVKEIQLPASIREEVGGIAEQRVWLLAIVSRIIVTAAD